MKQNAFTIMITVLIISISTIANAKTYTMSGCLELGGSASIGPSFELLSSDNHFCSIYESFRLDENKFGKEIDKFPDECRNTYGEKNICCKVTFEGTKQVFKDIAPGGECKGKPCKEIIYNVKKIIKIEPLK